VRLEAASGVPQERCSAQNLWLAASPIMCPWPAAPPAAAAPLQGTFELLSAWAVRMSKGRMWALSLMLM
jgi:hypothetical protein